MGTQDAAETEVPSHRACAHCRSQKVRCMMDNENSEACQRCVKSGRSCVFMPLQKRKQRKRTDTRVAELEREMRAMRSALKEKEKAQGPPDSSDRPLSTRPSGLWYSENSESAPIRGVVQPGNVGIAAVQTTHGQTGAPSLWPKRFANKPASETKDVVDSGIISMATARQLFETYRRDLFPHYPIVVIPDSVTADEVRQTKPVLFLSIIAAAAGKDSGELSELLDKEVLHTHATRSVVHSEKSLELIQSLLISAVWYHPPSKFGQLKYYEYIHMAATMAMDIGIGSRPMKHRKFVDPKPNNWHSPAASVHPLEDAKNPDLSMAPRSRDHGPDTGDIESRRTFLACYIVCAGVSMALRRPNMLRINSYVRECLFYLQRSPLAVPSDRTLVAYIKLVMIGDEISSAFCHDDPGGIACITELKTQFMLKDFERKLSDCYANVPAADSNESLIMVYEGLRLYLYEIALHVEHSPEDFKAPFQMGSFHSWDGDELPSQVLAESLAECITSAHNLLNSYTNVDVDRSRGLPVFIYVRVSYAAFVLAKLCLSAAHPGSRIGQVLDRSSLKAEQFMDRTILHVRSVVGQMRCRVPAIFLALLFKLRQWCLHPEIIEHSGPAMELVDADTSKEMPEGMVRQIEGPRIIDTFSGDESSPQNSAGDAYESLGDFASKTRAALDPNVGADVMPQSHIDDRDAAGSSSHTTNSDDTTPATSSDNDQPVSLLRPHDQMELDQNFFQFFGDMNGFPEIGLNGMDDWSSLPLDMMNFPESVSWDASATMTGTAGR